MIKVTDHHGGRLERVAPSRVLPALGDRLEQGAAAIVEHARLHINDGSISGPGHVASAPYDYPNSDTHELEQSLHTGELVETVGEIRTSAIADAPHAGYVELGTSKMAPRPYMTPSVEANRSAILASMTARFREMLTRG